MKKRIIALFKNNPNLALKTKAIARKLNIEEEHGYLALKKFLHELYEEGFLSRIGKKYIFSKPECNKIIGALKVAEGGYGFVNPNGKKIGEIFIAARNMGAALDGDVVEVSLFAKQKRRLLEGQIINVIKRNKLEIIGTLKKLNSFYIVIPDDPAIKREIIISHDKLNRAKNGDKVVVCALNSKLPMLQLEGKIIEILGKSGLYESDIAALAKELNLSYSFPSKVLKEAEEIGDVIPEEELKKRLDLRNETIITIDPEDAKDFDDAVSIKELKNGNYEVGVHIADVSHYVVQGSYIDSEAYKRGVSVYFVGKAIPMLPERLSNNICSLVPNKDRLTYSIIAEISKFGAVISYDIKKSVINSKRRFSYEEAQEILDKKKGDCYEELNLMNTFAKTLRRKRLAKGSIDFISREISFKLDENGAPISLVRKEIMESNNLIEELMLLANQIAALHIGGSVKKKGLSFIYRIHDQPEVQKVIEFQKFVRSLGYPFQSSNLKNSKPFQKLLESVKGKEEEDLINEIAIRSMAKAEYSTENIGHYGLGFKFYAHFTSPIRRYPDLMIHRLLFKYVDSCGEVNYTLSDLEEISRHCSNQERNAIQGERLSVKIKQIEYLKSYLGDDFDGVVSGVAHYGIFIKLIDSLAEGLVKIRDLDDDFYILDDKNYQLVGKYNKRKYRIGDKVRVKIIALDQERRTIDFIIVKNYNY